MEMEKSKKILVVAAVLWGFFSTSCSKLETFEVMQELSSSKAEASVPTSGIVRSVVPLWEARVTKGKEWTAHVHRELEVLGTDLLDVIPADYAQFCPRYRSLSYIQRKQYWTYIISAMVHFESYYRTEAAFTEAFTDSSGKKVVSRGLLQISIESGNAYGCGFKTTRDLHDPLQNLSCGIRILNRWVGNDARIAGRVLSSWRGGARYWAVLRSNKTTAYNTILKWSQDLSICQ